MKIAFLGKGGSGKSTMATALVRQLRARGMKVLAIDADHNMDLSYNLEAEPSLFLGADPDRIKEYVGSTRAGTYDAALQVAQDRKVIFTLSPLDAFTASVSAELENGLRLITAGPHTDRVRSQESCSHSLAAPLKVYLPLLTLNQDEAVVIDERAGTDPVATGILSGVDLAVIVQEPTINSKRVAEQIKRELEIAKVPHIIVNNKNAGIEIDTLLATEMILAHTY
ncbi:MAG: ATP-binding protein [Candidatus Kaiserbacteria bacterium]|nr:ATP-binding protein [Candidatus Kaiserbacteria bacterium]